MKKLCAVICSLAALVGLAFWLFVTNSGVSNYLAGSRDPSALASCKKFLGTTATYTVYYNGDSVYSVEFSEGSVKPEGQEKNPYYRASFSNLAENGQWKLPDHVKYEYSIVMGPYDQVYATVTKKILGITVRVDRIPLYFICDENGFISEILKETHGNVCPEKEWS